MDRGLVDKLQGVAGEAPEPAVVAAPADPFSVVPDELRGLANG